MANETQKFLAHTSSDGREQTVKEHLEGTAKLSASFASDFDAEDQGYLAGIIHDIGKYSVEFQNRILNDGPKVDHSTAGAYECFKMCKRFAAQAVSGHHTGLQDFGSKTDVDKATFMCRMRKASENGIPDYSNWEQDIKIPPQEKDIYKNEKNEEETFFTRMLYSCLVDADFLDTEAFVWNKNRKTQYEDIDTLYTKLKNFVNPWFPPKNKLNEQRCKILNQCFAQGEKQDSGLFTLTVPTGGGKTVSSMAFALSHAKKHGYKRIIYVVPYTSIIEQIADQFREIFGEENVLEHHSDFLYDNSECASESQVIHSQAVENWDMPIIVTTSVQFFDSLYAAHSSRCRKLHNIAQSVIVFDEAQMIPVGYLKPCVYAISELVDHYHVSAVLCTATQPALEKIFDKYLPGKKAVEICPSQLLDKKVFHRVTYKVRENSSTIEDISNELGSYNQVLSIVNTRKEAKKIYVLMCGESGREGIYHLSTLMCPNHRRKVLAEIRKRLASGKTCRVVSTSLIEAGVDVDFPAVFREESGLDSILQAAGRCNREGIRSPENSIVTVFKTNEKTPDMYKTQIGVEKTVVCKLSEGKYESLDANEAIHDYYEQLLYLKGEAAQDKKEIMKNMREKPFSFEWLEENFRLIDNDTNQIFVPYNDEAEDLIDAVRNGVAHRREYRKLQGYTVNVYPNDFAKLNNAGVLDILGTGEAILNCKDIYSEYTGLSLDAATGEGLFI